jgi:hypothetical protein
MQLELSSKSMASNPSFLANATAKGKSGTIRKLKETQCGRASLLQA